MSQPPKPTQAKPRGLGRGLSALLGDQDVAAAIAPATAAQSPPGGRPMLNRAPLTLPTAHLRAGKYQPRTTFDDLDVLVESVRQFGLLQPILVRPVSGEIDAYEIVAGERRWRAAQKAQLHDVPVVIRSLDDLDALQLALVENLQRTDLSAVDEAQGYRRLMTDFGQTQEDVARTMGRSRPHIANTLRLLDLPPAVKDMIRREELTAGHGRALLAFTDPEAMAARTIADKLTVRDLERLASGEKKASAGRGSAKSGAQGGTTADTKALEKRIEEALGLKASLAMKGKGEQTVLTLQISNYEQLDTVVERLTWR
jgi:ParB family chromosome partitioning protein